MLIDWAEFFCPTGFVQKSGRLLEGEPAGKLEVPTLSRIIDRIRDLEGRVREFEAKS